MCPAKAGDWDAENTNVGQESPKLGSGGFNWFFFYGLKQQRQKSAEKSVLEMTEKGCSATTACLETPAVSQDGDGALGLQRTP